MTVDHAAGPLKITARVLKPPMVSLSPSPTDLSANPGVAQIRPWVSSNDHQSQRRRLECEEPSLFTSGVLTSTCRYGRQEVFQARDHRPMGGGHLRAAGLSTLSFRLFCRLTPIFTASVQRRRSTGHGYWVDQQLPRRWYVHSLSILHTCTQNAY